ncbi:S41 family peptidase [Nonomuraea sp. NPDC050663]|uniref:S41 family peptidase n=1 Tax=Nonomuraea sp. NPDC050663 TaxID=3364370 RepID=UPI0037ACD247
MTAETIPTPVAKSVALTDALARVALLSADQKRLIVRQALLVLEQHYVNLPLKVARYGINPVARLRLLLTRLERSEDISEWELHSELIEIFNSVRDLHTRYALPGVFEGDVAVLPFTVKAFADGERRRYLVAPEKEGAPPVLTGAFRPGAEIIRWNGVPMARAVQQLADRLPGANPAARHARAVEKMTTRALAFTGPPDEQQILIDFASPDGQAGTARTSWTVPTDLILLLQSLGDDTSLAIDQEAMLESRARTLLFAPHVLDQQAAGEPVRAAPDSLPVRPEVATAFEARVLGEFGYIRIREFLSADRSVETFVNEFIKLLGRLPPGGVVIDVRGNRGGNILMAELSLQALTARRIEPMPAQFLSTPLNLRICRNQRSMEPWLRSMEQAMETGAPFSAGIPFTPASRLARVPQSYFGPSVLVTDARCYSSGDVFAAGYQDHGIGDVLGVDDTTGAGGANVWEFPLLMQLASGDGDFPYRPLPEGVGLRVAIRRLLRVGPNAGVSVEDFGVRSETIHPVTRDDIMHGDRDLLAAAFALLREGRRREFEVTLDPVRVRGVNVDRADFITDGRPRASVDLDGDTAEVTVPGLAQARVVRVEGYAGGELVAARLFRDGRPVTLFG